MGGVVRQAAMTAGDPVSAWGGAAGAGTGVVTSRRSPGAGQIHVCVTAAWDRVQQPDEGGQRGAVEISVDMQFRRVEETGDAQPTVVVYASCASMHRMAGSLGHRSMPLSSNGLTVWPDGLKLPSIPTCPP